MGHDGSDDVLTAVGGGWDAHELSEDSGEVESVGESCGFGDQVDGVVGEGEPLGGGGGAAFADVSGGAHAEFGVEASGEVAFAESGSSGEIGVVERVGEVGFDIFGEGVEGRLGGEGACEGGLAGLGQGSEEACEFGQDHGFDVAEAGGLVARVIGGEEGVGASAEGGGAAVGAERLREDAADDGAGEADQVEVYVGVADRRGVAAGEGDPCGDEVDAVGGDLVWAGVGEDGGPVAVIEVHPPEGAADVAAGPGMVDGDGGGVEYPDVEAVDHGRVLSLG